MIVCKYHPEVAARRRCNACGIDLCHRCIKVGNRVREEFLCPVCQGATEHLGFAHNIPPFWTRLPMFFRYPLQTSILFYLGVLTLFVFFAALLPVLGYLLYVFVLYAMLKYGFAILEHTARGHMQPPDSGMGHLAHNNAMPFLQLLLLLGVAGLVWATAALLSVRLGVAVLIFSVFLLPASTMLLGVSGNVWHAANPVALLRVVRAIGVGYAVLYALVLLIGGAWLAIDYGVSQGLPHLLGFPVGMLLLGYFVIVNFHLLGYVVYQHHEVLGYNADQEFDPHQEKAFAKPHSVEPIQQEVEIVLAEQDYAAAKERIKKKLLGEPNNLAYHHFCHQFLRTHGDESAIPRHAQQYLPLLMAQGEIDRALAVARHCLRIYPKFKLKYAVDVQRLGGIAYDAGDIDLALHVLNAFRAQFPGHKDTVKTQFFCAKIYHAHLADDRQAKMILRSLVGRHANHQEYAAMQAYLHKLENPPR